MRQRDLTDLVSGASKQQLFHPKHSMGHPLDTSSIATYKFYCSPQQTSHILKSCNQEAEELCFFPTNISTLGVIPQRITLGVSERARHTADTPRGGSPSESCSCLQTANPVQILAQGI